MIVDRRKDTYDELMLLSRDLSASRKRRQTASNWVIGSAMVVSGIYIAASSAHMSNLNDSKVAAEQQRDNLRSELAKTSAERDYYKAGNDWLRDFAKTLSDDDEIDSVIQNFPQPAPDQAGSSSIVWIVDGSRRYPVKTNDILWIPELRIWVSIDIQQTETENGETIKQSKVLKFEGPRPLPGEKGTEITEWPHYIVFPTNSSRCISFDVHDESIRPGFAGEYVDIEILYFTPSDERPCGKAK